MVRHHRWSTWLQLETPGDETQYFGWSIYKFISTYLALLYFTGSGKTLKL